MFDLRHQHAEHRWMGVYNDWPLPRGRVAVILITGHDYPTRPGAHGAAGVLPKAVHGKELLAAVSEALEA